MMVIVGKWGHHCTTCGSFAAHDYYVKDDEYQTVVVCPECHRVDGPGYREVCDRWLADRRLTVSNAS